MAVRSLGSDNVRMRSGMSRGEAAAVLGVPPDAGPDDVRRAWRMWARIAHPDAGGDPGHFTRLDHARHVLLQPAPAPAPAPLRPAEDQPPRPGLLSMTRRPPHVLRLVIGAVTVVAAVALPAALHTTSGSLAFAAAAAPAAVGAATWATWATRSALCRRADTGHRISLLVLMWLPIALAQQALAAMAGASLLVVLPLMALPLAAAASAMNLGAGLWRPLAGRSS